MTTNYIGQGLNIFTWNGDAGDFLLSVKDSSCDKDILTISAPSFYQDEVIYSSESDIKSNYGAQFGISATYGLFHGQVRGQWVGAVEESRSTHYSYCYSISHTDKSSLNQSNLILSQTFINDVNSTMTPLEVTQKYGTHVILSYLRGGTCALVAAANISESTTDNDLTLATSAYYKSAGASFKGSTVLSQAEHTAMTKVACRTSILYRGSNTSTYSEWLANCTSSPVFAGFTQGSLVLLSEIVGIVRGDLVGAYVGAFHDMAASHSYVVISSQQSIPSNFPTVQVTCAVTDKLIGGGAFATNGLYLTESYPMDNGITWEATAKGVHGTESSGILTVFAIALYDPYDVFTVRMFSAATSPTSTSVVQGLIDVEEGYYLVGGGARVNCADGVGQFLYRNFPTPPTPPADPLPEAPPPIPTRWSAAALAVGARSSATLDVRALGLRRNDGSALNVLIGCSNVQRYVTAPAQTILVGGGANVTGHYNAQGHKPGILFQCCPDDITAHAPAWFASVNLGNPSTQPLEVYSIGLVLSPSAEGGVAEEKVNNC